ncbi:MAG TPA: Fur family transcriptional regulator [bacterium]|nr:Fur family transcriptional regulator [bacterium]HQO34901.1 Fur family transcriptional regulator [bacterium]HQQ00163.1 Fur family transcriptional regulator [bacterium]
MKPASEELQDRIDKFKEGLKKAGVKLTHQRLVIFQEVARSKDHPDAETIWKGVRQRVPTVSLDTVYRTLWLLMDLGLIATLGFPHESVRFDANRSTHHHFVCTKCGKIRDFCSEEFDRLKIPDSVKELGHAEKMHVEVRGLCVHCSNQQSALDASRKEQR